VICELCGDPASVLDQGCCPNCLLLLSRVPTSGPVRSPQSAVSLAPQAPSVTSESVGQLALVTGGNRGIGRAIVERLLECGFKVHTIDIDGSNFEQMKREAESWQRRLTTTVADITDTQTMRRVVDELGRAHGGIQVLVNNAGVYHAAHLTEHSRANWDRQFAVNVTAPFELCQMVVPWMPVKAAARIINISSVVGESGGAMAVGYVASKHAIVGLTRAIALDLAPAGINVNAIAPGLVDTAMLKQIVSEVAPLAGHAGPDHTLQHLVRQIPQHRVVQPGEVADLAIYLASPASASVTGQVIHVSGGWMVS
jgi:3-hydroxybutyrate dehydrogenase